MNNMIINYVERMGEIERRIFTSMSLWDAIKLRIAGKNATLVINKITEVILNQLECDLTTGEIKEI